MAGPVDASELISPKKLKPSGCTVTTLPSWAQKSTWQIVEKPYQPSKRSTDILIAQRAHVTAWEVQAAPQTTGISFLCSVSCMERSPLASTCSWQHGSQPWWSEPDLGLSGKEAKAGSFQHNSLASALVKTGRADSTNVSRASPTAAHPAYSCWSLPVNASSSAGFLPS